MSKSHVNGGKKSGGHVRRKVASAAIKRQQLPQHIPPAFADFPNFAELQDRLGYKGTLQYIEAAREEKAAQMAFLGEFVTSEENTSEQKTSAFNETTSQEIEEETNQEDQENQENQKVEAVSESKSEETQASLPSLESTATSAKDAHTTGQSHQNALNQHGEGDRDTDASPDLSLAQENAPDVSTLAPEQAVTALAAQPPHLVLAGLNDLRTGIAVDVAGKHAAIADAPPSIQRPVGAKAIANTDTPAATETAPKPTEARLDIVDFGSDIQTPKQEAIQQTAPLPTNDVAQPVISATPEGTLNQESVDELKGSLDGLPTSDPGLSPGTGKTPQVERQGNADPSTMQTQHRHVQAVQQQLRTEGEAERVRDRGENAVYPQVDPNEALSAQIEPFEAQAPTVEDSTVDKAVAATAAIEQGEAIKTALSSTQDNIALEQQRYQSTLDQKKAENDTAIQRVEQENREQQDRERSTLQTDVEKHRGAWAKEQTDSILAANKDASEAHTQGLIKVNNKESDANQRAAEAIQKGQETAAVERKNAEAEATRKKDEAKKEEGGFFSWAASKVSSFFEGVKAAIQDVFERARQRVQKALTEAKNFATDIIEKARKAIVDAIQLVGNALIAIGDRLLKHFPALHEKYNRAIHFVVDKAQQAINALADGLKQSVQFLLDGLGKAINGVLNLYEKGMLLLVDGVSAAVQGALATAKGIVDTLGVFSVLITDVANNPMQWLKYLGDGIMDGIQNHLWGALKEGVLSWFSDKIKSVISLPLDIWDKLINGGFSIRKIAVDAWESIKTSIPGILIGILIEKLVAMIVPAAGAIMIIIDGLRAAWGAIERIIAAIKDFISFLEMVKTGESGPYFAKMVASAVVAVIDFVANWLIRKIAKKLLAFGGKLKKMATRKGSKRRGKKDNRKKDKKDKDEKISAKDKVKHKRYAKEIEQKLEATEPKEQESYSDFHKRVSKKGESLENKYQSKLKRGIKINVKAKNKASDESDVDVKIRIYPNDTNVDAKIIFASITKKFRSELNNVDPNAKKDITSTIRRHAKSLKGYEEKSFGELIKKLNTLKDASKLHHKPMDKDRTFGEHVIKGQAKPELKKAIKKVKKKESDIEEGLDNFIKNRVGAIHTELDENIDNRQAVKNVKPALQKQVYSNEKAINNSSSEALFKYYEQSLVKPPPHKKFEPTEINETELDDGSMKTTYKYGEGKESFEVITNAGGYPVSIKGDNLTLNNLGDGKKETPDWVVSRSGLDRAHLIANMFRGSGYREAKNIVLTSKIYNQKVMRAKEELIKRYIKDKEWKDMTHFNLQVDVTYLGENKKLEMENIIDAIKNHTTDARELKKLIKNKDGIEKLKKQIYRFVKKRGQPRVKSVAYYVVIFSKSTALDGEVFKIEHADFF